MDFKIRNKIILLGVALVFTSIHEANAACGLHGSVEERIQNCRVVEGPRATKVVNGRADEYEGPQTYVWRLVVQTQDRKAVWMDEATGILWGDRWNRSMNYYEAGDFCQDSKQGRPVKGHFEYGFRLPNIWEYEAAVRHGFDRVVPQPAEQYWSATYRGQNRAWYYDGIHSYTDHSGVYARLSVRCVMSLQGEML